MASTPSNDSPLTASQGQESVTHSIFSVGLDSVQSATHVVLGGDSVGGPMNEIRGSWGYSRLREEPVATEQTRPAPPEGRCRNMLCALTRGTICATLLCMSVSMIVVGLVHLHHCSIQEDIPVFLAAEGVALTLRLFLLCCHYVLKDRVEEQNRRGAALNNIAQFLEMTAFILLVIGSMKVYAVYSRVQYDPSQTTYCHHLLYWFAFCLTILQYVMVLLAVLFTLLCTTR